MAAVDEAMTQLIGAFSAWDWSPAFPVGYAGTKAPVVVPDWPYDLLDNILAESDGQMPNPVIAVVAAVNQDRVRTFGDAPFGSMSGTKAMGVNLAFAVSAWADERMGAGTTVKKLMGQVQGCVLANRIALTAFRHLKCGGGTQAFEERPQMWRADLHVTGDGVNSVA